MNVEKTLHRLRNYCEKQDFAGWDPYDAMNSPFLKEIECGETVYER